MRDRSYSDLDDSRLYCELSSSALFIKQPGPVRKKT